MADKKETTKAEVKAEEYTKTICKYDGREIPLEQGEKLTENEIKTLLSATFPELANADYDTEIKDGVRYVEFTKKSGTKGSGADSIVKKLDTLNPLKNTNQILFNILITQNLKKSDKFIEKTIGQARHKIASNRSLTNRLAAITPHISCEIIEGI